MAEAVERVSSNAVPEIQQEALSRILLDLERPRLVGGGGEPVELPDPIFRLLVDAVAAMRRGQTVLLVPENEEFTTQQAAHLLGVSRPHLIKLIEGGAIPFHKVGSHRRIALGDLEAYRVKRDKERREVLDELFDAIDADGAYE